MICNAAELPMAFNLDVIQTSKRIWQSGVKRGTHRADLRTGCGESSRKLVVGVKA